MPSSPPSTCAAKIPGTELTIELRPTQRQDPPEVVGGTIIVKGERSWLIRGSADDISRASDDLAGLCIRLDDRLLQVDFGNAIGRFPIAGGVLEVVSGKWTETHFERMLDELTAIAAGLPFAAGRGGALPYHRTELARYDVLYHAFVYLRHITLGGEPQFSGADQSSPAAGRAPLPDALAVILADPHRRWIREDQPAPIELARRVDPQALWSAAFGRSPLIRPPAAVLARMPVARALGGYLPAQVAERRIHPVVDTPENRFVKAFLGLAEQVIDDMCEALRRRAAARRTGAGPVPTAFEQRILRDCEAMDRALAPLIRHPLWRVVSRMVQVPLASTVLQRRRGYREVLGHFNRLRLATRLPLDSRDARELLELKDIALLYELWCYFTVVDRVSVVLGQPLAATLWEAGDFELQVPEEKVAVAWPDGTRLVYNPYHARWRSASRRSYSVPLRPDVALEVPGGPNAGLHLLDAKFRLDWINEVMPEGESDTGEDVDAVTNGIDDDAGSTRERGADYKRADLYKMHTYRDAISGARSVWILYPGSEARYFAVDRAAPVDWLKGSERAVLSHPLNGVGAIPLRPDDGGTKALDAWILSVFGGSDSPPTITP